MYKISRTLGVLIIAAALALVACDSEEPEATLQEAVDQVDERVGEDGEPVQEADEETDEAEETDESAEAAEPDLSAPDDVAAPPDDAEVTDSGLASKVLKEGTGDAHPAATDTVTVHYTGWTTDGERFDSSVARGAPTSFGLNQVIAGWTEGVQLMVVGETRRFWIPEELAYGGRPGRPAGMLVFDVELLEIQ